jgi:hypothetical protein
VVERRRADDAAADDYDPGVFGQCCCVHIGLSLLAPSGRA